jgi:hypothetical protein
MTLAARAQNGHWKSANSTIVTGAVRLPQVGLAGDIGTAASSSLEKETAGVAPALASEEGLEAGVLFDEEGDAGWPATVA